MKKELRLSVIFIFCFYFLSFSIFAETKLTVVGLSGELQQNVEGRLSTISPKKINDTLYFRRFLEDEVKRGLRALGYYEPKISFNYDKEKNELTINVDKGQPVIVKEIDVNIDINGPEDDTFEKLVNRYQSNVGEVLNQSKYDQLKSQLQSLALGRGYFDAQMTKNQLGVSLANHGAYWWIDYNLKTRFQFGKVSFHNSQIRDEYLENLVPFKEGEYYTSEDLTLLNRNLSSTNWFSSIIVFPVINRAIREDGHVFLPIYIDVRPKKKNSFDLGLGYSTDNGVRGKIGWSKPWINSRGQSSEVYLNYSKKEKSLTGSYKIPLKKSPLTDYYTIQGGMKSDRNNDTNSDSYSFGVARNWDKETGWQRSIGLNVLYDRFTQGKDDYNTFLLYPSFSLSRVRSDGSLFPLWGDSQRYTLEVSSDSVLSDITMSRVQIQQVWIRSLGDKHRFIGRVNFGFIETGDFSRVPPSFRFFAGGDRSIRGYSYQSISPRDSEGKLAGASKLLTGSIEYNYNLTGNWWGAAFVDSGEAINKLDKTNFKTGVGVGIRWVSPVGPIKLDLATPLNKEGDSSSVHLYLGLGTEL